MVNPRSAQPASTQTGMRTFMLIWLSQMSSLIGSRVSAFALGLWVYERSGSVTSYALMSFFAAFPGIIAIPAGGALADRTGLKHMLVLGTAGSTIVALTMLATVHARDPSLGAIYALISAASITFSVRWPSLYAAVPTLLEGPERGRASGLLQLANGAALVVAPPVATALLAHGPLELVLALEVGAGICGLGLLARTRMSGIARAGARFATRVGLAADARAAWLHLKQRPGLLSLLAYAAVLAFVVGAVEVLIPPFALTFEPGARSLVARAAAAGGIGVVLGGAVVALRGVPRQRDQTLLVMGVFHSLTLIAFAVQPGPIMLTALVFLFMVGLPLSDGCAQTIWMARIELAYQARVYGVRRVVTWAAASLGCYVAGPLAERVASRLPGGVLGPARAIAFVVGGMGVAVLAATPLLLARPGIDRPISAPGV